MRGSTDVVKTLLQYGANVNQCSNCYVSKIIIIIHMYNIMICDSARFSLLQRECDDIPLMVACKNGHIDAAMVLLDHGAIVDLTNSVKFLSS